MIKKRHLIISACFLVIMLIFSIYQSWGILNIEFVKAANTKPANGHSWTEMESDSDSIQVTGQMITNLAAPVNPTDAVTKAYADGLGSIPSGVILLWSGSIASIPSGWALCNGSSGTPDLRDRFVVGAGSTYAVAATGGEATHTLTGPESGVAQHSHGFAQNSGPSTGGGGAYATNGSMYIAQTNDAGPTNAASAHNNLPPYYSLAYIMKL